MKLVAVTTVVAVSLMSAIANAGTAIILMSGKNAAAVSNILDNWKNEKSLGDKLFTGPAPEVVTSDQMPGLPPGAHLVLGVCEQPDADAIVPVLQALYPGTHAKTVEMAASGSCPKLTSQPTKVVAKHVIKEAGATLTVALVEGVWDKGETLQIAIANVRDKNGELVEAWSTRVGTVLGGETCKGELKPAGKVIAVNRSCEGQKEIETNKLSLAKNRLKVD